MATKPIGHWSSGTLISASVSILMGGHQARPALHVNPHGSVSRGVWTSNMRPTVYMAVIVLTRTYNESNQTKCLRRWVHAIETCEFVYILHRPTYYIYRMREFFNVRWRTQKRRQIVECSVETLFAYGVLVLLKGLPPHQPLPCRGIDPAANCKLTGGTLGFHVHLTLLPYRQAARRYPDNVFVTSAENPLTSPVYATVLTRIKTVLCRNLKYVTYQSFYTSE